MKLLNRLFRRQTKPVSYVETTYVFPQQRSGDKEFGALAVAHDMWRKEPTAMSHFMFWQQCYALCPELPRDRAVQLVTFGYPRVTFRWRDDVEPLGTLVAAHSGKVRRKK
jgi:hypothetical protein